MVKLVSKDGDVFEMSTEDATHSEVLTRMIEDLDDNSKSIPLSEVSSAVLKIIIDYCQRPKEMTDEAELRKAFVPEDQSRLFELIIAANYLDMKSLMDLTCKTVADMLKGKTPEQIMTTFGLKNDFTPEEEEKIRRETVWAFD